MFSSRTVPTTQPYGGDPPRRLGIFRLWADILFKSTAGHRRTALASGDLAGERGRFQFRSSSSYLSVICLACTRLHFIHKETGKLLGRE